MHELERRLRHLRTTEFTLGDDCSIERKISSGYRGLKAPVVVSFFDRVSHLSKLLSALKDNDNFEFFDFFIIKDKHPNQLKNRIFSEKLQGLVDSQNQFNNIYIIERSHNVGPDYNIREAIFKAAELSGSVIALEDDLEVASGFLNFMEEGLNFAKNRPDILCVNGYLPPITSVQDHEGNIKPILIRRMSGWGTGFSINMLKKLRRPCPALYKKIRSQYLNEVITDFGADSLDLIEMAAFGCLDAGDVMAWVTSIMSNMYTLAPSQSLTKNNGLDGTGVHCIKTTVFDSAIPLPKQKKFDWTSVEVCSETIRKSVEFRAQMWSKP